MKTLIHRMQFENDETAFEEFYRENAFRLFQFAFAFIHNKELSEEIINDVLLKLWLKRSSLNTINNLNVYLYVSIKNTALNYLRKQNAGRDIDLEKITTDHFYMSPDPEQVLITDELRKLIEHSINQLPPRCKLIFKMVKQDGLSCTEVADILGISIKTVSAQLEIGIRKLKDKLKPTLHDIRIIV